MSWMSPSYVLQSNFNASWTPLAKRYTLWLYREVGWENEHTVSIFESFELEYDGRGLTLHS